MTTIPRRVAVIGDVMMDVIVVPRGPLAPTSDTPSMVRVGRGGAAGNLAVALARAGHDVTYVGVVGDDWAGREVESEFGRWGITPHLHRVDAPTGVVVSMVATDGQRSMFTDRGANAHLDASFVLDAVQRGVDHVHVSGYTLLSDDVRPAGMATLGWTWEHDVPSSVDVCSVGPLRHIGATTFLDAAHGATMLFANEEEARELCGEGDDADNLGLLGKLFSEVVVTRGATGAVAIRKGVVVEVPSVATHVVDTTGAGDAATGTYLSQRLFGRDIDTSLRAAMDAAAKVVRGAGALG